MRPTNTLLVSFFIVGAVIVLAPGIAGELTGHLTYNEARFSYSATPSNVVLHVTRGIRGNSKSQSMTLYGDGRLELELRKGSEVILQRSRDLGLDAVQAWLRECVDHGLVEWDRTKIRSFQRSHLYEESPSSPGESDDVTVLISLEAYWHGEVSREDLEKTIRIAPLPSNAQPDLLEYHGIQRLLSRLEAELEIARRDTRRDTVSFTDGAPRDRLYKNAELSYATDPDKIVLQVVQSSMDMHVRSMTLYGDGRLHVEDQLLRAIHNRPSNRLYGRRRPDRARDLHSSWRGGSRTGHSFGGEDLEHAHSTRW